MSCQCCNGLNVTCIFTFAECSDTEPMNNTLCKDDLTLQEVLIKFFHFLDDALDNPIRASASLIWQC